MPDPAATIGVYPGSFDPLTVAHLGIAEAAVRELGLIRLDLALSRTTLGKAHLDAASLDARIAAIERAATTRPWLGVTVVDAQLIADIAFGYDVVVMGADKWAQVIDPSWYGGDPRARDAALARLPRVAVAPRAGEGAGAGERVPDEIRLEVPAHLHEVSATAVRAGRLDWAAPEAELGTG